MNEVARKLIDCSRKRIKATMTKWQKLGKEVKKKEQKLRIIQRMIYKTKIGRVYEGFEKWKGLPERKRNDSRISKGNKFQRGLTRFVEKTLNRALSGFK